MVKRLLMLIVCTLAMLTAGAQKYISDVKIGGGSKKANTSKNNATSGGYTLIDYDLNSGASGCFIYLAYKRTDDPAKAITGLIIMAGKQYGSDYYLSNPITIGYKRYYLAPYADGDADYGDLNDGAGGEHLYLYYSKDEDSYRVTDLNISNSNSISGWQCTPGNNGSSNFSGCCDLNLNAGGKYIYMHYKRECIHVNIADGYCGNCGYNEPAQLHDGWYEINNLGNLQWFRSELQNNRQINGRLNADINCKTSIGLFKGKFDGQGHTISGLKRPLFTHLMDAEVKNVRIAGANIEYSQSSSDIYGLMCYSATNSSISECCFDNDTLTYTGTYLKSVGASMICGTLKNSVLKNCYVCHNVSVGEDKLGVLACTSESSNISNCYHYDNKVLRSYERETIYDCCYNYVPVYNMDANSMMSNCYGDDNIKKASLEGAYELDKFHNGEINKMLNSEGIVVWHQSVGKDAHPLLPWQEKALCCLASADEVGAIDKSRTYADVNNDKHVDVSDLTCLVDSLKNNNVTTSISTDVNFDNSVNISDIELLAKIVVDDSKDLSYVPRTGKLMLKTGATYRLPVSITPSSLANSLKWDTSDGRYVDVDSLGNVTPLESGLSVITATIPNTNIQVCSYEINAIAPYVDLGLPSGTLWATCNIGADLPEEYGHYFAWGETDIDSGKQYDVHTILKKYFRNQGIENIPIYNTLQLEDDAAYVNCGKEWRMPTIEDVEELYNECEYKYTTVNGVSGILFISKDKQFTLFLPDVGYISDGEIIGNGLSYYTSSTGTRDTGVPCTYFMITGTGVYIISAFRTAVRPVRRDKKIFVHFEQCSPVYISPNESTTLDSPIHPRVMDEWPTVVWSSSNPSVVTVDQNGRITASENEGSAYVYVEASNMINSGKDSILVKVSSVAKPEYVDLGLPSGTLWATFNVGAHMPEDPGLYFAWGETTGFKFGTTGERIFNWEGYKWSGSTSTSLIKYCSNNSFGTIDGKTTLDLEDDAAYVNWGPEWRMPTKEEIQELIENCDCSVGGGVFQFFKLTSKINGKSITFPGAGSRDEKNSDSEYYYYPIGYGDSFELWSNSCNSKNNNAISAIFSISNTSGKIYDTSGRYVGASIRPVRRK